MQQDTHERIKLGVDEKRGKTQVRWKVWNRGTLVADVRQPLVKGTVDDVDVLTQAIANHLGVDVHAVEYKAGPKAGSTFRYVPSQAWVAVPLVCEHQADEEGCHLRGCDGTPPATIPMNRNVIPIPADAGRNEYGVMTEGREVMNRVARETGLAVSDGEVGDNGWADPGPQVRQVNGWWFTVGEFKVRALSYEARESALADLAGYTAIYIDETLVARLRYARQGQVVDTIVESVSALSDERALAKPTPNGWWLLKNPPVGFNVKDPDHGLVEVNEPSTNQGVTLRVVDANGRYRFIERARDDWWTAAFGGAAIGGSDTWDRYRRRVLYSEMVIAFRHQAYKHNGPTEDCQICPGEVAGPRVGNGGHWWGAYVQLPYCRQCGFLRSEWEASDDVGQCPGAPTDPGAGHSAPDVIGVDVDGVRVVTVRRIDRIDLPDTGHPAPAEARESPVPVGLVHVRSSSPMTIDLGGGRQGLVNPTWCGHKRLPPTAKAWHVYGLKPQQVTCPICFHLFTCPWAQLKGEAVEHCKVCEHIHSCMDTACNPAYHPGFVPEPDPDFRWTSAAELVVERVHQALADGDFDFADRLIAAGEGVHLVHQIPGFPDGWEGLSGHVNRLRRAAAEAGAGEGAPAGGHGSPTLPVDGAPDVGGQPVTATVDVMAGAMWGDVFAEFGL